ncbi:hypothetical protein [Epibacterium ulvae]|uniref:hypothetical protein n=1 Tax=Epibacterium ulvae TaxID=1156985 RepID=UPI00248F54B1|nr:hypothetical protein [Epibacterium ulvae]
MVSLGVGVGVGAIARPVSRSVSQFHPQSLFSSGVVLLDFAVPNLFQDAAVQVPVIDPGDPVGRVLDGRGSTVFVPPSDAARPTYTGGGLSFDGVDDMLTAPAQVVREVFMVVSGMSGGTGADGVYPLFSEATVNRNYVHVINDRRISVDGAAGATGAAAVGLAPYEPATLDGKNMTLSSGDMLSATPVIISIVIPGGVGLANIGYLRASNTDFRNHFNLHHLIAFADQISDEDREQVIRYLADKTGAAL